MQKGKCTTSASTFKRSLSEEMTGPESKAIKIHPGPSDIVEFVELPKDDFELNLNHCANIIL